MNIVPLNDKIVVRRMEPAEKSPGGIFIPETSKEKPRMGKVLAVGEGRLNDQGVRQKVGVKDGDVVMFTSYAGSDIELEGEKYLIINESEVLAIVRK
jgi:chaperonin GroES